MGSWRVPAISTQSCSCSSGVNSAVSTTPPASALEGTVKVKLALLPAVPSDAVQPANFQPAFGTAVTVEQVPPFLTSWLVAPCSVPPVEATNSTGTFAPRTAMGSWLIRPTGVPAGSGMFPSGWGRRSSVT